MDSFFSSIGGAEIELISHEYSGRKLPEYKSRKRFR